MKLAFTTLGCPTWTLDQIIATARDLRYDGIELRFIADNMDLLRAPELSTAARAHTLQRLRDAQLEICCLDTSVRFETPDAAELEKQIGDGMAYIELAHALHAPFIRVFGDKFDAASRERVVAQVVTGLQRLGAHAQGTAVTVLLESHGDFAQASLLREVMERVAAPRVGILWDTHHPWRFNGEQPQDTVRQIGPWIRHTHWKDSRGRPAMETIPPSRPFDYVLFGAGEFPAANFLSALQTIHYEGWLAFEWEKKWHPTIAEPEVAFPQFIAQMRALL
jgi:sugar phosphate isomerase/epimerase